METSLLDACIGALSAYITEVTGVTPSSRGFRLSRTGELALNAFVRSDAAAVAVLLKEKREACVLWEIRPVRDVRAENGWLLFSLSPAFYEALTEKAAALDRVPGTDYVSLRMQMLMRKPPAPCPNHPNVHLALLRSLFADGRGRFTPEDDRAVLTMTHGEKGMARITLENNCGTVARALLMLRAGHC